jgi:hypothetical protein
MENKAIKTPEMTKPSAAETAKGIENHKKAAKHLEEAAKHHTEAAKHHEAGDADKAMRSTVKAQGHTVHATEAQRELVKQQAPAN